MMLRRSGLDLLHQMLLVWLYLKTARITSRTVIGEPSNEEVGACLHANLAIVRHGVMSTLSCQCR